MVRSSNTSRSAVLVALTLLVSAGCSGYPAALPQTSTDPPIAQSAPATVDTKSGEAARRPSTTQEGHGSSGDGALQGAVASETTPGVESLATPAMVPSREPRGGWPIADLWSSAEDRVGIDDDVIRLCVHAPLIFGPALNFDEHDFRVYWQMINSELGGIHGRKVEVYAFDDRNQPANAIEAAEACRSQNPFLMLAAGAESIPAVRQWAEQRRMFYLHGVATDRGTAGLNYSFSQSPSLERLCRILARRVVSRYGKRNVAVVYRDNSSWIGGRDAFKQVLSKAGIDVVADIPLSNDQTPQNYSVEIEKLKRAGAEVVLVQDTPIRWISIMRQAEAQGFTPQWMSWGALAMVGTAGGSAAAGAEGTSPLVPFTEDRSVAWADEISRMKKAYRRFHPHGAASNPQDLSWVFWNFFRDLHRMLADCGADCSRNRLAGMLLSGYTADNRWMCAASPALGRWSAYRANVIKLSHERVPTWGLVERCRSGL